MARKTERGIELTHREVKFIYGIGRKAVASARAGEHEFQPLQGLARVRAAFIPLEVIQDEIHAACEQVGIETQSFRPYTYQGDSASPFSPLVVRVIGEEAYPPLAERAQIPDRPGFAAVDVYPPQE